MSDYRLFVNDERTVLVHIWPDGQGEMATRQDPSHTWGPPVLLREDDVAASATSGQPDVEESLLEAARLLRGFVYDEYDGDRHDLTVDGTLWLARLAAPIAPEGTR